MPRVLARSLWILVVVTGIWASLVLLWLLIGLFWPGMGQLQIVALPEDALLVWLAHFLLEMAQAFPAIFLSSIVLAFSFVLKPTDFPMENRSLPEAKTLSQISLLLILGSSFLAFLVLFTEPVVKDFLAQASYKVKQTAALEQAFIRIRKADSQARDPEEKLVYGQEESALLQRLLILRPKARFFIESSPFDYEFEYQIIRSHIELEKFFDLRLLPKAQELQAGDDRPVTEMIQSAEKLADVPVFERNDYQINHLAYQALLRMINGENQGLPFNAELLQKAKDLITLSWQDVSEKTLSSSERLRASYFFRKGKSLGDYQFKNYLEAYYGFQELHRENPQDAEVARYEGLALEHVKETVLFAEDMDVLFQVPGWDNIAFRNPSPDLPMQDTDTVELVHIGRLLDTTQGTFVKDFEVLRYRKDGTVLLHWTAPYGKWVDGEVYFNVWHKNRPDPLYPKIDLQTNGNHLYKTGELTPPPYHLEIRVDDLAFLAQNELPEDLGTFDLMSHAADLKSLGVDPLPWQTEFVFRFLSPLAFLALSFATVFIAWLLRSSATGKMPWIWRSLVIILPAILGGVVEVASWIMRLLTSGLLSKFGFVLAFASLTSAVVALMVIFLVATWIELSRHRPR
jgi:hypothetical protein